MKTLTKSKYLLGIQCLRQIWINFHEPEKIPEVDAETQKRFDEGNEVGELAKQLFPGGIDLPTEDFLGNIQFTKGSLQEEKPLFEPGFLTEDGLYSRGDILVPKKSVFNKIIWDSNLELRFANFLETCDDIISYVKNYFGVHFKIDYKNADGNISDYYPDFVVKKNDKEVFIIETKGREDLDVPLKTQRLKQWCEDLNKAQKKVKYDFIYVDEESFDKYHPSTFEELEKNFREYKD